jgi:hypothetical protein
MAIDEAKVKEYLKNQNKLLGVKEEITNPSLDIAIQSGGALFWRENWQFAEREKTFDTTANTVEYKVRDQLEPGVDGIMGIRRLSSSDYGFDLIHEAPWAFHKLYPYPGSRPTGAPTSYTIYTKSGELWIAFFPEPDAGYTMETTYRLGWSGNMLAHIPDGFFDVFTSACSIYSVPPDMRRTQQSIYKTIVDNALRSNKVSRKRMPGKRSPGRHTALSTGDIALERGYYADDDVA